MASKEVVVVADIRESGQDKPVPMNPPGTLMRDPAEDWRVLGDTFEAMGKAGLAMTVGFTVAAAFCKMVDSGKIKLPNMIQLLAAAQGDPEPPPQKER